MKIPIYDKNKIILLRKQGFSLRKIAKIIGCSPGTVQLHCGYKPNEKCVVCKTPIYVRKCVNNGRNTCSLACRNKWFSKEKSPRWSGGLPASRKRNRQRERKFLIERKIKAINMLGGACNVCGYSKCIASLDFHHQNPEEKLMNLNFLLRGKWEKVILELAKCKLLCSNCHRELHWDENHKGEEEWIKTLRKICPTNTQNSL